MKIITEPDLKKIFPTMDGNFFDEVKEFSVQMTIEARKEIINEGDRIHHVPILLKGSVKVFTLDDGKELLYYYLKPYETCIMTFSSVFQGSTSRIYACAEETCEVLLLPVKKVIDWIERYPQFNLFFFREYDKRYVAIMEMVTQAVFHKLDKRILALLKKKNDEQEGNPVKISHKEIANTLGTAREVVSRILKKYENEGVISQSHNGIKILTESEAKGQR